MDRTFAMRQEEIKAKHYGINSLISRFPFLQEMDHVSILSFGEVTVSLVLGLWPGILTCVYSHVTVSWDL